LEIFIEVFDQSIFELAEFWMAR